MNKITGGKPGPGRPKGSQNKTTKAAKEAIAEAAEQLGGTNRLVAWAKEDAKNEHAFWSSIYPKLLPLQVAGEGGGAISVTINKPGA
ncbi:hypothetical protein [Alteraurantiacibacter buctensis]|uniref:DUF5681 domain-containing protein n=1 Tax=Alteraurantiacibacter buctensis TaxID=1503981 RepID=A0A844Z152_9SPHN|nr:hypothetical protein [Alteraurantiacibacter buctensis]MXO72880.1 hypothetical protein [Alteraurantiacibacter buctensis]